MHGEVSVAILAGGRSSRMGTDKSFALLDGRPMIAHVIERVGRLGLPVVLIANRPVSYAYFRLPVFTDELPGCGSLGGLLTALTHSPTEYTLCVACDMPFLHTPLLEHLIALRAGYQAVVPVVDDLSQTLHAVYHRTCRDLMRENIEQKHLKIQPLLRELRTCFVPEASIPPDVYSRASFTNLNTPEELAACQPQTWPRR